MALLPLPLELLEPALVDEEDELEAPLSEKRLVVPRVAPRLAAAELAVPPAEDEVLLAVLEDVTVEAAEGLELVEVVVVAGALLDDEPPNMEADADMEPRDDPRLPL